MKIVLPSPNGSTLACQAIKRGAAVLAGCLRNAQAVAEAAQQLGQSITVIPAGERWEDCSIRFALEDWLGAGAIIHNLRGSKSPESQTAEAAFRTHLPNLLSIIGACCSGRELTERSFAKDVELACEINISHAIPMMFKNTGCFQLQTG